MANNGLKEEEIPKRTIWDSGNEPPRPLKVIELQPWWRKGHAWVAALAWLAFYVVAFLVLLEVVQTSLMTGTVTALFFLIALFASFAGGKSGAGHSGNV